MIGFRGVLSFFEARALARFIALNAWRTRSRNSAWSTNTRSTPFLKTQAIFSPVQETALYTAFWRHCETTLQQDVGGDPQPRERGARGAGGQAPLITDQLAGRLVEAFLPEATQAKLRSDATFNVARNLLACRTKFIDDLLVDWYAQLRARSSAQAVPAQVLQN